MARAGYWLALLAAFGCNSATTAPSSDGWPWHSLTISGDVRLTGQVELARDTVQLRVVLRNQGHTGARVEFGVCAFAIQAVGRHGALWDNHPAPNVGCVDLGLLVTLEPGESRAIPVYRNAAAQIRQQVPSDYYQVSIFIRQDGTLRRLPAGGLEL